MIGDDPKLFPAELLVRAHAEPPPIAPYLVVAFCTKGWSEHWKVFIPPFTTLEEAQRFCDRLNVWYIDRRIYQLGEPKGPSRG